MKKTDHIKMENLSNGNGLNVSCRSCGDEIQIQVGDAVREAGSQLIQFGEEHGPHWTPEGYVLIQRWTDGSAWTDRFKINDHVIKTGDLIDIVWPNLATHTHEVEAVIISRGDLDSGSYTELTIMIEQNGHHVIIPFPLKCPAKLMLTRSDAKS